MTDFFGRLAERLVRPGDDLLWPATPSRFEPPRDLLPAAPAAATGAVEAAGPAPRARRAARTRASAPRSLDDYLQARGGAAAAGRSRA